MKPLLLILALVVSGCQTAGDGPPRPPFTVKVISLGESMRPSFGTQEWVNLEMIPFSELQPGDTVVFWHEDSRAFVHHRLTHKEHGRWVTKGDNNRDPDRGLMSADDFIGRTKKL